MKNLRIYVVFIIYLLIINVVANGQKVNSFTVQQAVDYGKQHSVQVKNALLDILIQKQTNKDITSIALPQISGRAGITDYLDIPITLVPAAFFGGTPGTYSAQKFGTKWNSNASVSLSQILFDGQVFIALKARNGTVDFQKSMLSVTEDNITSNIYKVYYQLVLSKSQTELIDANMDRLKKLNHDINVMYNNGFIERVDVDKITVQVANLQTEKLKIENMIKNGYSGLKLLMGMPIMDTLILIDKLSDEQIRESVLENSQYSYKDRSDYQLMMVTNKLNAYNAHRYKLSQIPTLSIVGDYSKQAQRNQFDFVGKGDWFTSSYIGLQMRFPIFNGFAIKAKIQGAKLQLNKTQNQTEALAISIDKEVAEAKNNFTTAVATMDYQKKNMTLAEKVYDQTKKKYEIGTGSTTEINTAQLDLKTAQTNYITALYDAIIAKIDFLKATGKL